MVAFRTDTPGNDTKGSAPLLLQILRSAAVTAEALVILLACTRMQVEFNSGTQLFSWEQTQAGRLARLP